MSDSDTSRDLAAYADGELSGAALRRVDAAIAADPSVREAVSHHQALRSLVRGAIDSQPVPADLRQRLRVRLAAQPSGLAGLWSVLRAPRAGLALAASIVLVLFFRGGGMSAPRGEARAGVTPFAPADFSAVHRKCAASAPHDDLKLATHSPHSAIARLSQLYDSRVALPDLRGVGFDLAGVCRCFPRDDIRVIHACYRGEGAPPVIVSFFWLEKPILLESGSPCGTGGGGRACRRYESGQVDDVRILKWNEGGHGFAVVARLDENRLRSIARSVAVALREQGGPLSAYARQAP